MSCSNVYWFETFKLPGLGPLGGRDSSAAGGGLGLRCVVDDLGPVGAILTSMSHLCGYGRSMEVWKVWLPSKAAPEEHWRRQFQGRRIRSTIGTLAAWWGSEVEKVWVDVRASDSDGTQRNCSSQARSAERTTCRCPDVLDIRVTEMGPWDSRQRKSIAVGEVATGVCWSYRLILGRTAAGR